MPNLNDLDALNYFSSSVRGVFQEMAHGAIHHFSLPVLLHFHEAHCPADLPSSHNRGFSHFDFSRSRPTNAGCFLILPFLSGRSQYSFLPFLGWDVCIEGEHVCETFCTRHTTSICQIPLRPSSCSVLGRVHIANGLSGSG
jgi:hypothetical protein